MITPYMVFAVNIVTDIIGCKIWGCGQKLGLNIRDIKERWDESVFV